MNFTELKNLLDGYTKILAPGNMIEICKDGKVVFKYASGYSDMENKVKMTGDEHLFIYSCSKVLTAVAGMQMIENGKILISEPLSDYIPEFKNMSVKYNDGCREPIDTPITIRNLFAMTAGFTYDLNSPSIKKSIAEGKVDTLSIIRAIANEPLLFVPGDDWYYSVAHDVLAGLISVVSGMKFSDYAKKYILEPLDMNDTYYHLTPEIEANMACQYQREPFETDGEFDAVEAQKKGSRFGKIVNVGKTNKFVLSDEYDSGGAGIITTADDYSKFLYALANGGVGMNGKRILASSTIDLMRENQLNEKQLKGFKWPQHSGYGYGLGVRTHMSKALSGSNDSIGAFGWLGAAGSAALVDPERNLSIFFGQHMLNPCEEYYLQRIINVVNACLERE